MAAGGEGRSHLNRAPARPAGLVHRRGGRRARRPNIGQCRSCPWPEPARWCRRRAAVRRRRHGPRCGGSAHRAHWQWHRLARQPARCRNAVPNREVPKMSWLPIS
uniref:Putative transposase n=1 Tax=Magnetospirillum gryphiswaldense TaxID=55518 RepID=Q6NE44_9PROT|nr:putative transposase [Magnetospirillum gryphiswaldense]